MERIEEIESRIIENEKEISILRKYIHDIEDRMQSDTIKELEKKLSDLEEEERLVAQQLAASDFAFEQEIRRYQDMERGMKVMEEKIKGIAKKLERIPKIEQDIKELDERLLALEATMEKEYYSDDYE
jgi:chromosome segregation ATPase